MFQILRIWSTPFKCNYLKNKKHFLGILFHLWNIHQISNISKKRKDSHSQCISKLTIVQELIRPLTKKHILRTSFDTQQVKGSQALVKSSWEHFYHIFWSLSGELIWLKSPWLKFEIIGVFVNTWIAKYMYLVWDCENLPLPIQMQLS